MFLLYLWKLRLYNVGMARALLRGFSQEMSVCITYYLQDECAFLFTSFQQLTSVPFLGLNNSSPYLGAELR